MSTNDEPDGGALRSVDALQPSGTVSVLFTDIEGSTRLVRELGDRYPDALRRHRELVREVIAAHGGQEVDTQGDAFFVAFARARDAVAAAVAIQRAHLSEAWPAGGEVRVRMGITTAEPGRSEAGYHGLGIVRGARLCAAAHGGQMIVSSGTRALLEDEGVDVKLRDLGLYELKGLERPERIHQLVVPGLPAEFPALRAARVGSPTALRRRLIVASGAAVAVVAAAAIASIALRGSHAVTLEPNSIGALDPTTGRLTADISAEGEPGDAVFADHSVWVAEPTRGLVLRVDARSHATSALALNLEPDALAGGDGGIWAVDAMARTVRRIDPRYVEAGSPRVVPIGRAAYSFNVAVYGNPNAPPTNVAPFRGTLWIQGGRGTVSRLDPTTGRLTHILSLGANLTNIAAGRGAIWITRGRPPELIRIDPHSARVSATIPIAGAGGQAAVAPFPFAVAVGPTGVWVTNANTNTVSRIDPEQNAVVATLPIGLNATPVATTGEQVWVASSSNGVLDRIDPVTNQIVRRIQLPAGASPAALTLGDGVLWVSFENPLLQQ